MNRYKIDGTERREPTEGQTGEIWGSFSFIQFVELVLLFHYVGMRSPPA